MKQSIFLTRDFTNYVILHTANELLRNCYHENLPSFILDMSTLELLSCSVACKAGSNCLSRFGSWSNGGIGDCGIGETGIAEADAGGADVGFSPEAEDVEGVVQECDTDLSPDVDSKDKGDNKAEKHDLNTWSWNQHQTSRIHVMCQAPNSSNLIPKVAQSGLSK